MKVIINFYGLCSKQQPLLKIPSDAVIGPTSVISLEFPLINTILLLTKLGHNYLGSSLHYVLIIKSKLFGGH